MANVRLSVKAIVIKDDQILLLKCRDEQGDWFMLPGGGVGYKETTHQALERECFEETGYRIRIGTLRFVRDYIADNHEFAHDSNGFHQVELWFACEVISESSEPPVPDAMQVGVEWLELMHLDQHRVYPTVLKEVLTADPIEAAIYLGDVN